MNLIIQVLKINFKLLNIPVREYDKPSINQLNKGADFINKVVKKIKKFIFIVEKE